MSQKEKEKNQTGQSQGATVALDREELIRRYQKLHLHTVSRAIANVFALGLTGTTPEELLTNLADQIRIIQEENRYKRLQPEARIAKAELLMGMKEIEEKSGVPAYKLNDVIARLTQESKSEVLIVSGPAGVGKTAFVQSLVDLIIQRGFKAVYAEYAQLVFFQKMEYADAAGNLSKVLQKLSKFKVLVLDDFLLNAQIPDEANTLKNLFDLCRTHGCSLVLSGQLPATKWYDRLCEHKDGKVTNVYAVEAAVDRLTASPICINLHGRSNRAQNGKKMVINATVKSANEEEAETKDQKPADKTATKVTTEEKGDK